MKVVSIIPARMGSSRFPGKPLADILGKTMIEHCYQRASMAEGVNLTYVATCDQEIADCVKSFGGNVVMTSILHDRATTRSSEALEIIEKIHDETFDIVVMVQGDEPLISPEAISLTIKNFDNKAVDVVNIMSPIFNEVQFLDKNNVKVVCDSLSNAMYFSRLAIPHNWAGANDVVKFMQTGIIAFRRKMLIDFNIMKESPLEKLESVDMNRLLEAGVKIRMVASDTVTLGVDVPDELVQARVMMSKDRFFDDYRDNH
jgi:3-deoxy-manno-octulosonate cytidylyltransferase (CMP-KDO synthetase)